MFDVSEQSAERIRTAVEAVEQYLQDGAPPQQPAAPRAVEVHFVRITSTTQTGGRYPGKRYDRDADGFTEGETVWVDTPNGESLNTGTNYAARLIDDVDGVDVYDVIGAITSTGGVTVSGITGTVTNLTFSHSEGAGVGVAGPAPNATITIGSVTNGAQTWAGEKTLSGQLHVAYSTGIDMGPDGYGGFGDFIASVSDVGASIAGFRMGWTGGANSACYVELRAHTADYLHQKLNVVGATASGSNDGAGFAVNGSVGMTGSPGNGWQFKGGICTTLGTFGGSITIGTTTVSGGTAGGILYNTGAVVGNASNIAVSSGGQLLISGSEPADGALSNGQGAFWFS
jgi:hypothetical protein